MGAIFAAFLGGSSNKASKPEESPSLLPPKIASVTPADAAINVILNEDITVIFTKQMNPVLRFDLIDTFRPALIEMKQNIRQNV